MARKVVNLILILMLAGCAGTYRVGPETSQSAIKPQDLQAVVDGVQKAFNDVDMRLKALESKKMAKK